MSMMTADEILGMMREAGALLEGHFQLSSGLHSPRYIQCAKVLQYPRNAGRLCAEIARYFRPYPVDVVVAPALGGIVVGQEVGRQLDVRTLFTERKDGVMQLRRGFRIEAGEHVLVCEDVITTGGSVGEVLGIVRDRGAEAVGVGAIVDRSGGSAHLANLFAAVTIDAPTYRRSECPLCARGVPIDTPGSRNGPPPGSGAGSSSNGIPPDDFRKTREERPDDH